MSYTKPFLHDSLGENNRRDTMNTKQTEKRAFYTLSSVTQEDRESRSKRIRDFFKEQPALAYLMAAFDFEWTVRRAMSKLVTATAGMRLAVTVE